jgi:U3 small nucleolar RNA-associated protein 14
VVITEKWDKKASKYAVEAVPHGFGSAEIYEAATRHPLGKEYNTDLSFRNMTRPAVLKHAGVLIDPIKYSQPVGGKRKDSAGPRGARDLVKQVRLRQKL